MTGVGSIKLTFLTFLTFFSRWLLVMNGLSLDLTRKIEDITKSFPLYAIISLGILVVFMFQGTIMRVLLNAGPGYRLKVVDFFLFVGDSKIKISANEQKGENSSFECDALFFLLKN